jgi:hypothetical protein
MKPLQHSADPLVGQADRGRLGAFGGFRPRGFDGSADWSGRIGPGRCRSRLCPAIGRIGPVGSVLDFGAAGRELLCSDGHGRGSLVGIGRGE